MEPLGTTTTTSPTFFAAENPISFSNTINPTTLHTQSNDVAIIANYNNSNNDNNNNNNSNHNRNGSSSSSRYENQKRRDWNTFCQYLRNHRPPLSSDACTGAHVLEFLRYLDQFGKTKVHNPGCPFFGLPTPPAPCPCPLRQAWGSLDALVGRLRAAFEEHGGGLPEVNPFGTRPVRVFLREVRNFQSRARGISYDKKRKRRNNNNGTTPPPPPGHHHHHHHHQAIQM